MVVALASDDLQTAHLEGPFIAKQLNSKGNIGLTMER